VKAERDKAYKTAASHPSVSNVNTYKILNKEVKKLIQDDSKNNINCLIKIQGVFTAMKSICKLKSDKGNSPFNIEVNKINEYFVKISTDNVEIPLILPPKQYWNCVSGDRKQHNNIS